MNRFFCMFAIACWATVGFAQFTVEGSSFAKLVGVGEIRQIGETYIVKNPAADLKLVPVGVVKIEAPATASIAIDVSDKTRQPVEFIRVNRTTLLIESSGTFWVDVTLVDFESKLFDKKTIVVEVAPGPGPGPGPGPEPGPTPDGPFDGLSARVAAIAAGMTTDQRNQIAGVVGTAADRMQSFQFRQISQASDFLAENWPEPCNGPCRQLSQLLNADAEKRQLSWQETQQYYREIVKGLL